MTKILRITLLGFRNGIINEAKFPFGAKRCDHAWHDSTYCTCLLSEAKRLVPLLDDQNGENTSDN